MRPLSRTKVRQCLTSLISKQPRCYVCGREDRIELHHIFGHELRRLSEHYGLTVMLCPEHHRGKDGVHGRNGDLDRHLRRLAESLFTELYGHDLFMRLFGDERSPRSGARGR